ncbi:ECF transporter S component [Microbacterium azadirachtae]|jgi:energy-coupling factor transport system substrate-specific component|uniref:Putative HMP/thiamine permease protein YkoE n=1 Tax=Microbacterium azadirachtae TaxID=582680 RepID=A0A0F0KM96_9MICO|nr:ECF transporter S component [Microbacterium azadirachtae]KJL22022.1 putative HMP/thiamine permease protein YkoE [Microbacterium azadirachtae]SDM18825.1 energy-coupling factor transport system substrate-specific component [Microbacterium azadirachtae]SEG41642.1 energy-coupling factor transport system substrate-specific component [Microbacterium azadirachtae]SEG44584.1 energy-coupling factor transport system substrate-specific component [Microbacterium azadirachtae]
MHATATARNASTGAVARRLNWRVVDIVVAAVLGVAIGLVFWVWNTIGYAWFSAADALTPGLGGIAVGIWLLGGVVGGLVIRKPGAALVVEVVAAVVSMLIGNIWGVSTVLEGIAQGLGAELIFAVFLYRRFSLPVAALSGVAAAVGAWVFELFYGSSPNILKSLEFNAIYLGTLVVSGAVLAGVLGWLLVRALAATGALSRFAAGRELRREV